VAFVRRASCQTVEPVCRARICLNLEVWGVTNSAAYSAGNLKCLTNSAAYSAGNLKCLTNSAAYSAGNLKCPSE
jgi:hypothetical protein